MDAEALINSGLVWRASEDESFASTYTLTPSSIIMEGQCHEFFLTDSIPLKNLYPASILLPVMKDLKRRTESSKRDKKFIVFLGKEVWPTPFSLRDFLSTDVSLSDFLFINPVSSKSRERSLEILARSSNVLAVVTSLKKVSFSFTQKLHLFSKQSGTYTLIFRENNELNQKSAAYSRWIVRPVISQTDYPSWSFALHQSKGSQMQQNQWLFEGINEEEVSVYLLSELVSKSHSENLATARCA